jgi:hypothetical protein
MFVVVAFDETNETDFAPVTWIADKTKTSDLSKIIKNCSLVKFYWPPMRSASAVSRAQNNSAEPEITWPTYVGRVLATAGNDSEDFSAGNYLCNVIIVPSDG